FIKDSPHNVLSEPPLFRSYQHQVIKALIHQ
ncbi:hypothetical protein JMJ77_0005747, partial [Colletotrichum scovillei]